MGCGASCFPSGHSFKVRCSPVAFELSRMAVSIAEKDQADQGEMAAVASIHNMPVSTSSIGIHDRVVAW